MSAYGPRTKTHVTSFISFGQKIHPVTVFLRRVHILLITINYQCIQEQELIRRRDSERKRLTKKSHIYTPQPIFIILRI